MKIANIVGARPQFVKAAAVSRVLRHVDTVREVLIHTGQHYDEEMSGVFFAELDLPEPAYDLGIGSGSHGQQTGRMLEAIEGVLTSERPDWALVYGDTNSTLAGALAAAKMHIPVAHVEAGLRSFNRAMPEEINRVVTDHVCDLLFAPTQVAARNLLAEGVPESRIQICGDVMYDAAMRYREKAETHRHLLDRLEIVSKRYLLITLHRAENTDSPERLRIILSALGELDGDFPCVFPLHPRTRKVLAASGILEHLAPSIRAIDPVGFLDMLVLEQNAKLIGTDSGGVQKEAFFYGVPCVTFRDETEWVELLECGWNRLAPPHDVHAVLAALRAALTISPLPSVSPYGDGYTAERIVNRIVTDQDSSDAQNLTR